MEIKQEKTSNEKIDWDLFASPYLIIEENEPTEVILTKWAQVKKEFNGIMEDGLTLNVKALNGKKVNKILETTSRRLIMALKPLIETAELTGNKAFVCRIIRSGKGFNTNYSVKTLNK